AAFAAEVAARRHRGGGHRGGGVSVPSPIPTVPERPRPGVGHQDDLTTRLVTAGAISAVALIVFALGRAATATVATVIVAACALELYEAVRRAGFQPAIPIGILGSAAMVPIAYNYGERAFPLVGAIVAGFTFLWYLARVVHARPLVDAAMT